MKRNIKLQIILSIIIFVIYSNLYLTTSEFKKKDFKRANIFEGEFNNYKSFGIRKLQNNTSNTNNSIIYQDVCIVKNYSYELMEYINPLSKSLTDVIDFSFIKKTDSSQSIINFIKDRDGKWITKYIIDNSVYFVILIFAILAFQSLFYHLICCCFPRSCFRMKENPDDEKPMCRIYVLLLVVLFSILGFICCILCLSFMGNFLASVDSISCSVNKFVYEIKNGENKTETPRWMGIKKIISSYNAAINMIPIMSDNYISTFNDNKNKSAFFLNLTGDFIKRLDNIHANYKDLKFENINPRASQASKDNIFRPDFITNLGNYTNPKTKFGQIVDSIKESYYKAIDSFKLIQENSNKFIELNVSIKEIMNEIIKRLNSFDEIANLVQKNFTDVWLETRTNFNKEGHSTSLDSLVGLISLLVLNFLILFFYVIFRIQCCRFFSHIFWMILTLITICTFITSFAMGMVSSLSYDAKSVLGFVFSDQNLFTDKYLINHKEASDLLNVCLNYGGDLGSELYDLKNSDLNYMDKIYQFSYNILEKNFQLNLVTDNINFQIKNLQVLLDDIRLVNSGSDINSISPKQLLEEFQKWTDFYAIGSYQSKYNCKTITRDAWTINSNMCPVGFQIRNTSNGLENLRASNCYLINTWSDAYIFKRYIENPYDCDNGDPNTKKTNQIKDPDFSNFTYPIYQYWNTIKKYNDWHMTIVNNLIQDYLKLLDNAKSIEKSIETQLNLINAYTRPLFNLFYSYVGKTNTFQILNCGFMLSDLQYIMKSLEIKLSSSSLKLCISSFFMSLFNMAVVILSVVANLRFRIIIKRKIIRNQNKGEIAEFEHMYLKESEQNEPQEIEMRIINNNENEKDYSYKVNHDANQIGSINPRNKRD